MVCRYLENRICYDSPSGSGGGGGGGTSDEDFDQGLQQDIAAAAAGRTRDNFGFSEEFDSSNDDTSSLISATRDVLASDRAARDTGQNRNEAIREAERAAASRPNVQTAVSNLMNPNITQPDLSDYGRQDFFNNQARQQVDRQIAMGANYTPPKTQGVMDTIFANRPQNLVNSLQAGASQFMGNRFNEALMDSNNRPIYDPSSNRVIGVETSRGTLLEGRGLDDGTVGGDNENAFPFANQQGQQVAQMAPGQVAPEAIDDLAINYLQNPYYAYSGFGNQFSPYGYAPGTLVDLLQTRGMTQPEQADTLGLFGNPTDFS